LEFRILGPLELRLDDVALRIAGPRQRALLALLLCNANRVMSRDQLIEELLSDQPADSADRMLRVQLSRLRSALSAADGEPRLIAQPPGYRLRIEAGELDLHEFERLVSEGRAALERSDPGEAAALLGKAESLWRGRPLADLEFEPFARLEVRRLEELRLCAVEDRIDAELALGRHAGVCPELEALVGEHPLRDRLRGQLMLALYRCGRQADALAIYRAGRSLLVDELALEPSPQLKRLEEAILRQDGALELREPAHTPTGVAVLSPPEPQVTTDEHSSRATTGSHRRRLRLASGLALAAFVGVSAALVWRTGSSGRRVAAITANSVAAINPVGGAISAVVPAGSSPSGVAAGAGAVWVSSYNAGTVSRIDPAARAVVQTIQAGSTPSGIAVGAGAVWVANNLGGTVSRIDPGVNTVVQTIAVGNGPSGVAVGEGAVWVANSSGGTLTRIDAVSGEVKDTIALGGSPTDVAVGLRGVWVSDEANGRVLRVDPQTHQVTQAINVGTGPSAITVGDGSVWAANALDGTVSRIDPLTNRVTAVIAVGDGPSGIGVGGGGVWVANEFGGTVARIDPATDTARTITVGSRPVGVAIANGLVWVGAGAAGNIHRGGTLRVLFTGPLTSLDPAQAYSPGLTSLTNDGLTALKRVGGSDGTQVVPDLATSLPTPTDGGLTYTFQLRPGIRYSNGEPLRPDDFRRALERDFELGDAIAPAYYANVVGGAKCVARPVRCDLSHGIVSDDSARTVTFHLVAPDPELLDRLAVWDAVAVPPGTPDHDVGRHPIPATGAYEITRFTSREVRLVRNPYFYEWSRAARPAGYPDQIVLKLGASPSAELTAVERGSADYTVDGPPTDRLDEVRTRFASQLHINPSDVLDQLALNTRVAPFNDLRVRRALSYAVDRAKIAGLVGSAAQPTCQFLTPYVPGYKRYCPYTIDPNSSGMWRAPDLAAAERLIAASHTRGAAITVWDLGIFGDQTGIGHYIVSLLDRLGYTARMRNLITDSTAAGRFADSRNRAQVALSGYFPNYPAASEFIRWFLSCENFVPNSTSSPNWAEFCDPQLDGQIRGALAAQDARSPAAREMWAQADRTVTDQAPLVPLVTPSQVDFVSYRIGNYQYNPEFGVLLDQLWVR
jgi:YVTN family beta-propeller protein